MKKPIIVANWKMNPATLAEAKQLFDSVKKGIKKACPELNRRVEVVICPPFIYLPVLEVKGAQDVFWEKKGAYTGEISPKMLKDAGCQYVIIGHSERRKYQGETDPMINRKIKAAFNEGLKVILCVEMASQIKKDLKGIPGRQLKNLILAFEPVSAIGTGKPYNLEAAKAAHLAILRSLGKDTPVLYGGSVNSQNAADYIKKAGFRGLLVGGTSLNPKEFIKIVRTVNES